MSDDDYGLVSDTDLRGVALVVIGGLLFGVALGVSGFVALTARAYNIRFKKKEASK